MRSRFSLLAASCLLAACGQDQTAQSNRPPELVMPAAQIVVEGGLVQFKVSAADPDDDALVVAGGELPEGAIFAGETGQFTWVPTYQQSGNYNVGFSASDARFTVLGTVPIAVLDNNRPPELDGLSDVSVVEGQTMSLAVHASDPDDDTLTFEALQLPRGAEFDPAQGRLTWRPGYDQAGTYTVLFIATDEGAPPISARGTVAIRVENYTEPIIVQDFPIAGFLEGGGQSAVLSAQTVVLLDFSGETDLSPSIAEMKVSNVPSMADASWQPFTASVEWLLPPGDGPKTVYARFRDLAENVSPRVEGTIDLDTTPPFPVSATLLGPAITRESEVTLLLAAQDRSGLSAAEAVTVSEDPSFPDAGGAFPQDGRVVFPLSSGQGAKIIHVRFRDAAGNDAVVSVALVKDTAPPVGGTLTVISPTGNGYTSSVSVLARLEAPADGVQVTLAAAGNSAACGDTDFAGRTAQAVAPTLSFLLPPGDGQKRVCARLLDAAGNPSLPFSDTIILDTEEPTAVAFSIVGFLADGSSSTAVTASTGVILDLSSLGGGDVASMRVSNLPALSDAVWQPYAAAVPWILPPGADGSRTVYAQFKDAAGNPSTIVTGGITIDTTAPSAPALSIVEDDSRQNGFTNQPGVSVRLSAGDVPVRAVIAESPSLSGGVSVPMAGLSQPVASPFTLSAPGQRTVWARFYDAAGNGSELAAAALVLDRTPPARLAATLVPSGYTTGLTIQLVPPNAGQDDVRVTGDVTAPTGFVDAPSGVPILVTLTTGGGIRNLSLVYRDLADNSTDAPPLSIVLDGAAPTGCALTLVGKKVDGSASAAEKSGTPNVAATVSGCTETPAEIFLTSGAVTCAPTAALPWQPYEASLPFTLPGPDGTNTVRGCVRDAAGNVGALAADTIELDTQPPSAASVVLDGGSEYVNAAQFAARGAYRATAQGSALGAVEWAISESTTFGALTSATSDNPKSFTFSGEGRRTLYALFKDDVGNTTPVVSDSIVFDTAAPAGGSLTVVSPTANGFTNSVSVVLQLVAPADAAQVLLGSAVTFAACADADLTGRTPQPLASTISFLLSSGEVPKRVCAKLLDAAGNASAFLSGTITLDTTAPTQPRFASQPARTNAASVTLTLAQTASDTNAVTYQWTTPSITAWSAVTFPATPTLTANAANRFRVRAVDPAGNLSAEDFVEVVHDDRAPPAPAIFTPRRYVNDTTTSVTLSGSNTDPSFATYQTCTSTTAAPAICPATCTGTFANQQGTFAQPLTANQKTCVYARALDGAGNPSTAVLQEIVSDLIPPTPPALQPLFDPSDLTIHAPYVDAFLNATATDLPLGGAGWGYKGVAYLEVDTGVGYSPLCPQCVSDEVWNACAATCICADARRQCSQTTLVAVRATLVPGASNRIAARAVDLAGNIGDGVALTVNTEGEAIVASGPRGEVFPHLSGTTASWRDNTGTTTVFELGENGQADPGDRTCTLPSGSSNVSSWPGAPGVLYKDANAYRLKLRRRGADGAMCTSDDTDIVLTAAAGGAGFEIADVSLSGERAAWIEWYAPAPPSATWKIFVLEPGSDGLLTPPAGTAASPNPVLVHTITTTSYPEYYWFGPTDLQLADRYLLFKSGYPCAGAYCWHVLSAAASGFASGSTAYDFPTNSAALALDGRRLFTLSSSNLMSIMGPGADGVYTAGDSSVTRTLPSSSVVTSNTQVVIDGVHAVVLDSVFNGLGYFNDWAAGPDAAFGTADDSFRQFAPASAYRSWATMSGGLLIYGIGSPDTDLRALNLSTMRWEVVKEMPLTILTTNGAGVMFASKEYGAPIYARRPDGSETSGSGFLAFGHSMAADGRFLLTATPGGAYMYNAGSDGVFFTADDDAASTVASANTTSVWAGEGKMMYFTYSSTISDPTVLEPGAGTLASATKVNLGRGNCAGDVYGYDGGISREHAAWSVTWDVCFHDAGADGVFGAGDPPTARLMKYPNQPGIAYQSGVTAGVRAAGNRIAFAWFSNPNFLLTVVDAGPDHLFNTSDDNPNTPTRDALNVPITGKALKEYTFVGDQIAYIATPPAGGGSQVYVYDLVTGNTVQKTFHLSSKQSIALDPSGRIVWSDSVFPYQSAFVSVP